MAKAFKKNDIAEKGVLDNLTKGAIEAKEALDELLIANIDLGKQLKKNAEIVKKQPDTIKKMEAIAESTRKASKAVKEINQTRELSLAVDKQILALRKKLSIANSDSIQEGVELQVQLQEQNKSNKELAKTKLGLISTFEKESKKLKELRSRYKSLRLETGKETKETKKLRKEIKVLSGDLEDVSKEAGQFGTTLSQNVDDLKSTTKGMLAAGAAAIGLKLSFDGLGAGAQGSAAGSENLRKVTGALTGGLKQGANVVASTIVDLFNFTKAVASGEKGLTDITEAFVETSEATENFSDKVAESAEKGIEIAQSMIDFEKAARPLEQRMSSLNKIIEEQALIAGDGTRSFNEIREAAVRSQEAQTERATIAIKLAKEELRILDLQVDQANKAGGAGVELLDQQTEAIIKLQEARNAASLEELQTEQILRQEKQDRLERDLDILIDGFDNQKTINERLIADERKTFDERKRIFAETTQLANESFLSQKKVLEELSEAGIDVDELLKLDATTLAKRIRELEQSEIIEGRTLEVVRERRIVLQDLADIERELDEVLKERIETQQLLNQEIDNELKAGELAQAKRDGDLESEFRIRKQVLEDNAEFETNIVAKTADERRLIAIKLANDLAALEQDQVEAVKDANDEIVEDEGETAEQVLEFANQTVDKTIEKLQERNEARNKAADDEIERLEESVDEQRRIASEGGKNILAEETALLAKRRLERQRELEAQAKQERLIALAQTFVNSVAANSKDDPDTAIAKALFTTFAAEGLASLILSTGSAFDGRDDTGTVSNPLDSNGGRLMTIHDNEQIWSKQNVKDGGGRTRNEAINILQAHDQDLLMSPHAFKSLEMGKVIDSKDVDLDRAISNQTEHLKVAIAKSQTSYNVHWNTKGEAVEERTRGGSVKKRIFKDERRRV